MAKHVFSRNVLARIRESCLSCREASCLSCYFCYIRHKLLSFFILPIMPRSDHARLWKN